MMAQVRRLMAGRLEAKWRFSTLYLVKDSLAAMLRAAGLMQDALREFYELEATFLSALATGGSLAGADFGACTERIDNLVISQLYYGRALGLFANERERSLLLVGADIVRTANYLGSASTSEELCTSEAVWADVKIVFESVPTNTRA